MSHNEIVISFYTACMYRGAVSQIIETGTRSRRHVGRLDTL